MIVHVAWRSFKCRQLNSMHCTSLSSLIMYSEFRYRPAILDLKDKLQDACLWATTNVIQRRSNVSWFWRRDTSIYLLKPVSIDGHWYYKACLLCICLNCFCSLSDSFECSKSAFLHIMLTEIICGWSLLNISTKYRSDFKRVSDLASQQRLCSASTTDVILVRFLLFLHGSAECTATGRYLLLHVSHHFGGSLKLTFNVSPMNLTNCCLYFAIGSGGKVL